MQDLASTLLPLIAIALVFWLLIIRPQSRKQRELRDMQTSLSVGDEVVLTSGIHGVVRGVDSDVVQVEVSVRALRLVRSSTVTRSSDCRDQASWP